jgi:hypothetical protein
VLDGGPLQGTSRQTPAEVRNRLEQKYDVRFDQVEKEIKDRLGVAQEANEKLGDVDDTPLTRAQMSSYRSIMLGEAREAGAAGKNELARIYSTIADGIEKDFADVKTITELNDIPDYEQGKLVLQDLFRTNYKKKEELAKLLSIQSFCTKKSFEGAPQNKTSRWNKFQMR